METLVLAILPFIVTGLTSVFKRIPVINNLSDGARLAAIRLITAVFALAAASGVYALGGDPITETSVNEFVMALYAFLGAIGAHSVLKNK